MLLFRDFIAGASTDGHTAARRPQLIALRCASSRVALYETSGGRVLRRVQRRCWSEGTSNPSPLPPLPTHGTIAMRGIACAEVEIASRRLMAMSSSTCHHERNRQGWTELCQLAVCVRRVVVRWVTVRCDCRKRREKQQAQQLGGAPPSRRLIGREGLGGGGDWVMRRARLIGREGSAGPPGGAAARRACGRAGMPSARHAAGRRSGSRAS